MIIWKKKSFQIILVIVLSLVFVIPNIPNSYEHAFVTKSNPIPSQSLSTQPSKIDVYFSDPIDIHYSQLKVLDSNGNEVQGKDQQYINNDESTLSVSIPPGLKDGIYTVTTKVLDQTDGHVTENAYVFAIGQTVPPEIADISTSSSTNEISVPEAIVRFPALVGQVMAVGITFSTLWLWGPISRIAWLENRLAESKIKIDSDMIKLSVISSIILLTSGFAIIAVQAYSINAGILDAISTKFGNIWVIRMIASVAFFAISFTLYHRIKKSKINPTKNQVLVLFGIGFAVLVTTSLISHGASTGNITLVMDLIHNIVSALWIGGVFYLAFILVPNLKRIKENIGLPAVLILIPRFSIMAITILGAIVITGPFLLFFLENNLALTLASTYGKILIIKLVLAGALIIIGGYHQMVIHRQVSDTHRNIDVKNKNTVKETKSYAILSKSIISKFNKSVKIEALIGIALIASVAVLVDSGLPSSEFQNQLQSIQGQNVFALTIPDTTNNSQLTETKFIENGGRVILIINPFSTGNNDFKISFLDKDKNPIDMKSVQIRLTQLDKGIGPITIDAERVSTGMFSANTAFGFSGHWSARIEGVQNKENSLNLVASYDLLVKPKLESLVADINEFKFPGNSTLPLYPVYDKNRNVVWVGDSAVGSGRIFEFDLAMSKFIEHKIKGVSTVTSITLDSKNDLWYADPISKSIGNYNPNDKSNKIYKISTQGIIAGITNDASDNIWIIDSTENKVLKFNPVIKNFTSINLGEGTQPLGITIDKNTNQIWIAEGIGKIASINTENYKIEEYAPLEKDTLLASPSGIIVDPMNGNIYVSEHDGFAVSVFNPFLKTFKKYILDDKGLPFGMTFDGYHNLWIAQHTIDKIAVMDQRTGQFREFNIPSSNSFVQWITTDIHGNIIMAEDRANALGIITVSVNPGLVQERSQSNQSNLPAGIPRLGFDYVDMAAPSITVLLISVAFFYSKSVKDLKNSIRQVKEQELTIDNRNILNQ